jgi:predicted TIM-barrel fold metal-dependent hydrolase
MTFEIIDIHPHIIAADAERYPPAPLRGKPSVWSQERPQTFEQLVAEMDAAGVAKAAIVQASTYYGFDNTYIADSVAKDPDRFTGVCTINVFAPDAIDVLKAWMTKGFSGLRIFTGGATHGNDETLLADPRSYPIWEFAAEANVPICVQTGPVGLANVRNLLDRFATTTVILDHIGRPKLDDGPPYADARSLFDLAEFPNLYLKLTPRSFALAESGASTPEAFFPKLIAAFGANRIAYGSNLPANEGPMTALITQATSGLASLSDEDTAMILSGTAKHLYPSLA